MRRTVVGLGVALVLATVVAAWNAGVPAHAETQPAACPPLQLSDIEDYLEVKAPVAVVRRRVNECGLGFTFDKTAEDRLRTLGAQADLRMITLSHLESTFSVGLASAAGQGIPRSSALMFSFKLM